MAPRRTATRTKAEPKSQERSAFDHRWGINRFPNTNIARDLEPHERVQKVREAKELGIEL